MFKIHAHASSVWKLRIHEDVVIMDITAIVEQSDRFVIYDTDFACG